MPRPLILASGSDVRTKLLLQAGVPHRVERPRVDEEMIKAALLAENATPRDIADALAEMKARKVSDKNPSALVLGCDQVLDHRGKMMSKPENKQDAMRQLSDLRNDRHTLLSAAVVYEDGKPIWRHVGTVRMLMRAASDDYIDGYVKRNWDSIHESVGGYKLEEEGVRLFTRVDGDYFTVLGMPLLELLNFLMLRGEIDA